MNLLCPQKKKAALRNCSAEGRTRMDFGCISERRKVFYRDMQLLRKRSVNSTLLPLLWAWARMAKLVMWLSWFTVRAAAERLLKNVFSISSWGNPLKIQSGSIKISSILPGLPCPCNVCAQVSERYSLSLTNITSAAKEM